MHFQEPAAARHKRENLLWTAPRDIVIHIGGSARGECDPRRDAPLRKGLAIGKLDFGPGRNVEQKPWPHQTHAAEIVTTPDALRRQLPRRESPQEETSRGIVALVAESGNKRTGRQGSQGVNHRADIAGRKRQHGADSALDGRRFRPRSIVEFKGTPIRKLSRIAPLDERELRIDSSDLVRISGQLSALPAYRQFSATGLDGAIEKRLDILQQPRRKADVHCLYRQRVASGFQTHGVRLVLGILGWKSGGAVCKVFAVDPNDKPRRAKQSEFDLAGAGLLEATAKCDVDILCAAADLAIPHQFWRGRLRPGCNRSTKQED